MKKTYYLFNPGRLQRQDNTLKFTPYDEDGNEQKPRFLPVENVQELYCFGNLEANSALYNFLGKEQISVHFFDYYENYTGSFMPRETLISGKMLISQVRFQQNKKKRIDLAQRILTGAAFNMVKNLKYYNTRGKDLEPIIAIIGNLSARIKETNNINELMGIEGNIRKNYYQAFDLIINDFNMQGRSYRPPLNEINALISFGNMMCYSQCLKTIHQTQLNPTISFLHEPGTRRFSLSLDLAEVFKPLLVDRVIFKVLNKKMIQTGDFEETMNRIVLRTNGKKTFVQAFEDRLTETINHRTLNRSVSYKHLIKLECYKLQKHILEIEEYKPFKMWW
ncbi:MAG: type I-B CRISPR-associated endonuclease Cas1b [Bacteroidales bacterium]|jgi:CRISPR-associated protein Cas1|nr:type I-B CRISPR-associated endonuclease Cas1b [Bacteroidales bacterium]MDD2265039.1 type I-B CRISPR-associated endonuclease Cas1b [Bacteroidales bacterium]MDD2832225.1 type I-B CRISPR-associated endonuclease Cas1b [Bacteroidales bacterium]MDD4474027.1 type I-B CRISPR-associated endonuclease Cas1b [Bacteroidales bacterium]MDD5047004.1 type I-B CRISPR-associated endonuclease Cas1b [Bacteroidales bacterium]